jgi:hypothetical protein
MLIGQHGPLPGNIRGGGFEDTVIVTIIIVIMMAQLAFNYELTSRGNSLHNSNT